MKSEVKFILSFEKYVRVMVVRSGLPKYWVIGATVIMVTVIIASIFGAKNSVISAKDLTDVIEKASERGDYETARKLWIEEESSMADSGVLGAQSELEDKVYPEAVVERKITELESKLEIYSENRELYLELSNLYQQLGDTEKSGEYHEKARVLDPNDPIFQ